jgi:hypothetical protein
VGTLHVKRKLHCPARRRRPRPRHCMRKGCGREYQPRRWNQRYCQEPECLRQVRQWQAARRQAKHRQAAEAKARHAQAERERRERAKAASQAVEHPEVASPRGHAAEFFFRSLVRSAGLSRTPRDLTPQPGTVLLLRLPSGGSQCPGSGTQVACSRHVGGPQEAGLRVPSRSLAPVFAAV